MRFMRSEESSTQGKHDESGYQDEARCCLDGIEINHGTSGRRGGPRDVS